MRKVAMWTAHCITHGQKSVAVHHKDTDSWCTPVVCLFLAVIVLQAPVYSLSAFSMALQELPRAVTADADSDTSQLRSATNVRCRGISTRQ